MTNTNYSNDGKRLEIHIMKSTDSRGTRDFFIIDHDNNVLINSSTHSTPYNYTMIANKTAYKLKGDLKKAKVQYLERGYKQVSQNDYSINRYSY